MNNKRDLSIEIDLEQPVHVCIDEDGDEFIEEDYVGFERFTYCIFSLIDTEGKNHFSYRIPYSNRVPKLEKRIHIKIIGRLLEWLEKHNRESFLKHASSNRSNYEKKLLQKMTRHNHSIVEEINRLEKVNG